MATELELQIARRRTFAIISHPDAGKTTLTEKLLLYGGALRLAGSVTARKNQRRATSDWMELEQQRGISVTSTVLQFEYDDHTINLLDTPGHEDFSEDTYRTLTAADSAVMLIDAAKGIEPQTRKLFEVCRLRRIPIFTFINKMDRPGRPPIELIDELEQEFGIVPYPFNWPIGSGPSFAGVYDRLDHQAHLYERTERGAYRALGRGGARGHRVDGALHRNEGRRGHRRTARGALPERVAHRRTRGEEPEDQAQPGCAGRDGAGVDTEAERGAPDDDRQSCLHSCILRPSAVSFGAARRRSRRHSP